MQAQSEIYKHGLKYFTNQQYAEALQVWQSGIEKDDPHCLCDVGYMYVKGLGVSADPIQAFQYMLRSAKLGYPRAMNNIGVYYYRGTGTTPDPHHALYWLYKCRKAGFPRLANDCLSLTLSAVRDELTAKRARSMHLPKGDAISLEECFRYSRSRVHAVERCARRFSVRAHTQTQTHAQSTAAHTAQAASAVPEQTQPMMMNVKSSGAGTMTTTGTGVSVGADATMSTGIGTGANNDAPATTVTPVFTGRPDHNVGMTSAAVNGHHKGVDVDVRQAPLTMEGGAVSDTEVSVSRHTSATGIDFDAEDAAANVRGGYRGHRSAAEEDEFAFGGVSGFLTSPVSTMSATSTTSTASTVIAPVPPGAAASAAVAAAAAAGSAAVAAAGESVGNSVVHGINAAASSVAGNSTAAAASLGGFGAIATDTVVNLAQGTTTDVGLAGMHGPGATGRGQAPPPARRYRLMSSMPASVSTDTNAAVAADGSSSADRASLPAASAGEEGSVNKENVSATPAVVYENAEEAGKRADVSGDGAKEEEKDGMRSLEGSTEKAERAGDHDEAVVGKEGVGSTSIGREEVNVQAEPKTETETGNNTGTEIGRECDEGSEGDDVLSALAPVQISTGTLRPPPSMWRSWRGDELLKLQLDALAKEMAGTVAEETGAATMVEEGQECGAQGTRRDTMCGGDDGLRKEGAAKNMNDDEEVSITREATTDNVTGSTIVTDEAVGMDIDGTTPVSATASTTRVVLSPGPVPTASVGAPLSHSNTPPAVPPHEPHSAASSAVTDTHLGGSTGARPSTPTSTTGVGIQTLTGAGLSVPNMDVTMKASIENTTDADRGTTLTGIGATTTDVTVASVSGAATNTILDKAASAIDPAIVTGRASEVGSAGGLAASMGISRRASLSLPLPTPPSPSVTQETTHIVTRTPTRMATRMAACSSISPRVNISTKAPTPRTLTPRTLTTSDVVHALHKHTLSTLQHTPTSVPLDVTTPLHTPHTPPASACAGASGHTHPHAHPHEYPDTLAHTHASAHATAVLEKLGSCSSSLAASTSPSPSGSAIAVAALPLPISHSTTSTVSTISSPATSTSTATSAFTSTFTSVLPLVPTAGTPTSSIRAHTPCIHISTHRLTPTSIPSPSPLAHCGLPPPPSRQHPETQVRGHTSLQAGGSHGQMHMHSHAQGSMHSRLSVEAQTASHSDTHAATHTNAHPSSPQSQPLPPPHRSGVADSGVAIPLPTPPLPAFPESVTAVDNTIGTVNTSHGGALSLPLPPPPRVFADRGMEAVPAAEQTRPRSGTGAEAIARGGAGGAYGDESCSRDNSSAVDQVLADAEAEAGVGAAGLRYVSSPSAFYSPQALTPLRWEEKS